jgi:hypothetical protein
MAKKKSIDELSAEELFALAQQREEQEAQAERELVKQQVEELKARRKELIAQHRKEISALDKEIKRLGGRTGGTRKPTGVNVTDAVMEIVYDAGEISTKEIKAKLDSKGVPTQNLSQTLAYLKRQGRVHSPSRSVYAPV